MARSRAKSRVRVVHEYAVAIADHPIRVQKESDGNRTAIGIAAYPAQHAVIVAEILRPSLSLNSAVGTLRIDERLKCLGLNEERGPHWFSRTRSGRSTEIQKHTEISH